MYSNLVDHLEALKLSNDNIKEVIDKHIDFYKCRIEMQLIKKTRKLSFDYYSSW